jgi:5-formaminoimidazole-4-carboxamide-1-beta-D-ribofuranosyl 5'-monophosphate synthetase
LKAIIEKNYVIIYAKICYDLDKELPQKIENVDSGKRTTSYFRGKLLEKCKNIFKDDLENMVKYIVAEDEEEKEQKIKQFILGSKFC